MALQEDNDVTGDVISVNGEPAAVIEKTEKEDRGDDFSPEESDKPAIEAKPEPEPRKEVVPQHIPKARFDEVNTKKNELAEQLAEAQRQITELRTATKPVVPAAEQKPAFDEDAKEQEYIDALMDGNNDLAKSIRREINAHMRSQVTEEVTQAVETRSTQRQVATSLAQASAQAVADFPYLDTEDGEEALELIVSLRDSKIAKGMTPAQALREAVEKIAPKFAPVEGDTPSRELTGTKAATDTRTANALARGATDSTLQPPSAQVGVGNRATNGRVNVSDMSEDQFENLSAADKKRLRGDM